MSCNKIKIKILELLSKFCPFKSFRLLLKSYSKVCECAPEYSSEVGNALWKNYRLFKKYSGQYKIISLGWNCMPRTLTTHCLLKPSKGAGEKSMPFDLAGSPPKAVQHFLETDFSDYFSGVWSYDEKYKWWRNDPSNGAFYPHDKDCGPDDLEFLKKRFSARIANFREAVKFDGPILFVMHKVTNIFDRPTGHTREDFESVCREIARIRGNKPYKILIIASDHDETCTEISGASFVLHPYPDEKYTWHNYSERFTPAGVKYELGLYNIFRSELEELLRSSGVCGRR